MTQQQSDVFAVVYVETHHVEGMNAAGPILATVTLLTL